MTYRLYLAVQLALFLCYLLDTNAGMRALWFVAMYGVFFWNSSRVDLWMRNRDHRGRFTRGHGPISG